MENVSDLQERIKQIYRDKRSAVVRVVGLKKSEDPELKPQWNIGTGFFISRQGHVMTNALVYDDATDLWIEMQNKAYEAVLIGRDFVTGLSILKAKNLPSEVNYLTLDEVGDLPDPGIILIALSYPFGMDIELSNGLMTGLTTSVSGIGLPTTHLKSNILCHGGEMGAPVFDLNGKLIGIKIASIKAYAEGATGSLVEEITGSLILPSRAAMRVRDDLIFSGKVTYGSIGMRPNMGEIFKTGKMIVEYIEKNSAGNYAGLKPGDEIMEFNQYRINNLGDFCDAKFFARPGQYVNMKIKRKGKELNLTIKMDESPSPVFLEEIAQKKEDEEEKILAQTNAETLSVNETVERQF